MKILAVSTDFEKLWVLRDLLIEDEVIIGTREHALEMQLRNDIPDMVVWDGTCRGFIGGELVSVSVDLKSLAAKYGYRVKSLNWLLLKARVRAFFRNPAPKLV